MDCESPALELHARGIRSHDFAAIDRPVFQDDDVSSCRSGNDQDANCHQPRLVPTAHPEICRLMNGGIVNGTAVNGGTAILVMTNSHVNRPGTGPPIVVASRK